MNPLAIFIFGFLSGASLAAFVFTLCLCDIKRQVRKIREAVNETQDRLSVEANCSAVGGEFYNGLEWLGAWLVDHAEGETITEELVRCLACEAWREHLKRQNDKQRKQFVETVRSWRDER